MDIVPICFPALDHLVTVALTSESGSVESPPPLPHTRKPGTIESPGLLSHEFPINEVEITGDMVPTPST